MTRMLEGVHAPRTWHRLGHRLDFFDRQNHINMALASITMAHERRTSAHRVGAPHMDGNSDVTGRGLVW